MVSALIGLECPVLAAVGVFCTVGVSSFNNNCHYFLFNASVFEMSKQYRYLPSDLKGSESFKVAVDRCTAAVVDCSPGTIQYDFKMGKICENRVKAVS